MNKLVKPTFRPPGENKKGFKPPARLSQESSTPASNNEVTKESEVQSNTSSQPAEGRKPMQDISNAGKSSSQPTSKKTNESSEFRPSIIWDSQGSQPMAEAELPEWAKELPVNSESFMDQTNEAHQESNLIDVSIFDDVLRKTLDGEKTKDGRLLADIRPGVEVTHESPTVWSSQEISNRLSQSQKSAKSSQSNNEVYTQAFESSQPSISNGQETTRPSKLIDTRENSVSKNKPKENIEQDSPDFDAFNCTPTSENNDAGCIPENLTMENDHHCKKTLPNNKSLVKNQFPISNPCPLKTVQQRVVLAEDSAIEDNQTFLNTSLKPIFENNNTTLNTDEVNVVPDTVNSEVSNKEDCLEETPVKKMSKSKYDGLINEESDYSGSEFDAVDEHVFSQVMSQLSKTVAAYEHNDSFMSSDEEAPIHEVDKNGDCNAKIQCLQDNAGSKITSQSTAMARNILKEKKRNTSVSSQVTNHNNGAEQMDKNRSLYHKTLMKRHKDIRQQRRPKVTNKNIQKESRRTTIQPSLKKKLLELQKSRKEAVWVECCNLTCKKWRYLKDVKDPAELPNIWTCNMNIDGKYNTCNLPEQKHEEVGDKLENFVECRYTVGSVVWARVAGQPWWPAMVDDDPDTEEFYWTDDLEDHFSIMVIPSWYHVIFFDRPNGNKVERAWIRIENLKRFRSGDTLPRSGKTLTLQQAERQKAALKNVENSLKLDIFERRRRYSFAERYQGKWAQSVDWDALEEDED